MWLLQGKHQNFWNLIMIQTIYIMLRKWVFKLLERNLNDLSMCFNANWKIDMGLKIEMTWYIYMRKKYIK